MKHISKLTSLRNIPANAINDSDITKSAYIGAIFSILSRPPYNTYLPSVIDAYTQTFK